MKIRKLTLGNRNLIGARVTEDRLAQGMKQIELLARLQTVGVDLSTPALSLLEGQKRPVTDIELNAIADILNVSVDWLLGRDQKKQEHRHWDITFPLAVFVIISAINIQMNLFPQN